MVSSSVIKYRYGRFDTTMEKSWAMQTEHKNVVYLRIGRFFGWLVNPKSQLDKATGLTYTIINN